MDTTETYIKMCNCEDIQGHEPQAGDYYWAQGEVVILPESKGIKNFCTYECLYLVGGDDYWWLPRQDKLQEMVKKDILIDLIDDFYLFVSSKYIGKLACFVFTSMEQLWLAFVMKEKYNKVWNGDVWEISS